MKESRLRAALPATDRIGLAAVAGAAAATAAAALWVRHRTRRAEQEHLPAGRFVRVVGVRLHHLDRGEGPPVVLLHGNTVLLQDFAASGLIERLAGRHRVVAFDRPGFGYSTRPRGRLWTPAAQAALLVQAFARMGLERPVVVGHSWGAMVALALAAQHPSAVRGLVLLGGYYYPTARLDVPLVAPAALPVVGDALRHTVSPLLGSLLLDSAVKAMFSPMAVPPHYLDEVPRGLLLRPQQLRADAEDAAFMVPAAAGLRRHYAALRLPVHILAGDRDRIVDTPTHAERLHRDLPDSTLTILPQVGHMVHYAAPRRIVALIDDIFGRAPRMEDDAADRPV